VQVISPLEESYFSFVELHSGHLCFFSSFLGTILLPLSDYINLNVNIFYSLPLYKDFYGFVYIINSHSDIFQMFSETVNDVFLKIIYKTIPHNNYIETKLRVD